VNPAIRRRLPWAAAVLVAVAAFSLLMSDPADFLLGVLGGVVVSLIVGYLAGAFRSAPKV
jgi:membrane protease YdiL (CAAX protease family)